MQEMERSARDELKQLHETVAALRAELEKRHGGELRPKAGAAQERTAALPEAESKARPKRSRRPAAEAKRAPKRGNCDERPEERRRKLQRAEMLLNISREVAGIESLDDVLEKLVEITSRETDCERSTLFLNDDQTGELYSRVAQGEHPPRDPPAEHQRHRRPCLHHRRRPHHRRRLFRPALQRGDRQADRLRDASPSCARRCAP